MERRGAIGWVSWWGVSAPKPFSMFHRLAVPIDLPGGGGGSPGGGPPPPPPPPKPPPPPPLKSDDSPAPPLLKPDGAAAAAPAPDMNFCESCCASAIAAARASRGTAAENPAASAGGPSEKPEPAAGASEKRLRRLGGSSTALSRSRDRERSRSRLLRSSSRRDSPRSDMAESFATQRRTRPRRRLRVDDDDEEGKKPTNSIDVTRTSHAALLSGSARSLRHVRSFVRSHVRSSASRVVFWPRGPAAA